MDKSFYQSDKLFIAIIQDIWDLEGFNVYTLWWHLKNIH